MNEREQRILANEILFREVNERIEQLGERMATIAVVEYVCECGQADCTGKIALSHEQYESVRTDGQRFVTLPDHETAEIESVVEAYEGYQVVEKDAPEAARAAEEADPRDADG